MKLPLPLVTRTLGSLVLLASLVPALGAAAPQLERLKYNHPGLVVDLGVGLWAWPLPMDFDGDRLRLMTKIWNDAHSLKQLGWA